MPRNPDSPTRVRLTASQRDGLLAVALGCVTGRVRRDAWDFSYIGRDAPLAPRLPNETVTCRSLARMGLIEMDEATAHSSAGVRLTEAGRGRYEKLFPEADRSAVASYVAARLERRRRDEIAARVSRVEGRIRSEAHDRQFEAWDAARDADRRAGAAREKVTLAGFALGDGGNDVDSLLAELRTAARAARAAEAAAAALRAEAEAFRSSVDARVRAAVRAEVPEAGLD